MNTTPPAPLHIKSPGIVQLLLFFVLGLALCALFVHIALHDEQQRVASVIGIVLFGGCAVFLLFYMFRAGEIIYTIDEEGVHFTDTRYPMVAWRDIEKVKAFSSEYQRYVGLVLRDEKAYCCSLPRWRRLMLRVKAMVGLPSLSLYMQDRKSQEQCMAVCAYWLEQEANREP